MIVAIVHYHLRRGGVTRVIEHALRALPESVRPILLCGEIPPGGSEAWPCPVQVVDGLGYDAPRPTQRPRELARAMEAAVRGSLGRNPDLWHIHNHSLGKNASLTRAVSLLAEDGHRLLLQIHDLPEDGRPTEYEHLRTRSEGPIYPAAPHIHYAAINRRDYRFIHRAGLPDTNLHALPNAVWVDTRHPPGPHPNSDLFLYPTRAIRRKNLGEFLLWASAAESGQRFAVTLAPENPRARRVYDGWVAVSRELNLPVSFELGADPSRSFANLVRSAQAVVTTSVAEGFGLAYLEPWLLGRPLAGRNLPEITDEFADAGVSLPGLYNRLDIPLERVDLPALRARLGAAMDSSYAAYLRPLPPGAVDQALDAMIRGGHIDFGRLDEQEQERILRSGAWSTPITTAATDVQIAENAETIRRDFSLERYGIRLQAIYAGVAGSETGALQELSGSALLDCFLDPSRFNLLRT